MMPMPMAVAVAHLPRVVHVSVHGVVAVPCYPCHTAGTVGEGDVVCLALAFRFGLYPTAKDRKEKNSDRHEGVEGGREQGREVQGKSLR